MKGIKYTARIIAVADSMFDKIVLINHDGENIHLYFPKDKIWKPHNQGDIIPKECYIEIPIVAMDALRESLRYTSNKGKLEATERHLRDMRELVFERNPDEMDNLYKVFCDEKKDLINSRKLKEHLELLYRSTEDCKIAIINEALEKGAYNEGYTRYGFDDIGSIVNIHRDKCGEGEKI